MSDDTKEAKAPRLTGAMRRALRLLAAHPDRVHMNTARSLIERGLAEYDGRPGVYRITDAGRAVKL